MLKNILAALAFSLSLSGLASAQSPQTFTPIDIALPNQGGSAAGAYNLNAAAESGQVIGKLYINGGSGTKTLSAAGGGSIVVWIGTNTFATASTELRVGLEDLTAGGVGDGTQDVYGAKIAGTDALTTNGFNRFTQTNGTKTVTHGANLSISVRMPVRAGVDSVNFQTYTKTLGISPTGLPYGAANGTKASEFLFAAIKFDDGTFGWIEGANLIPSTATTASISTATTPDEYCGSFNVSAPIQFSRLATTVDNAVAADDYEILLYTDPYGSSPTVVATASIDSGAITFEGSTNVAIWGNITAYMLQPSLTYCLSLRPTTANAITFTYGSLGSGFDDVKALYPIFTNVKLASRVDNTGAFTETQTYHMPYLAFSIGGAGATERSSVN